MQERDRVAYDLALEALHKIQKHEAVCEERWANSHHILKRLDTMQSRMFYLMMGAQAFVISALLAMMKWH